MKWIKRFVIASLVLLLLAASPIAWDYATEPSFRCMVEVDFLLDEEIKSCLDDAAAGGYSLLGLYALEEKDFRSAEFLPLRQKWRSVIEQAAASGHRGATTTLGIHYYFGVPPDHRRIFDPENAFRYLRMGAEAGHPMAQSTLSSPKNVDAGLPGVEALKWRIIDEERPDRTRPVGDRTIRDKLVRHLTPAEVDAAQIAANEWLATCHKLGRCSFDPDVFRD